MDGIGSGFGASYAAGQRGIAAGSRQVLDAASRLAQDVEPEAVVDLSLGQAQVEASAATIRATDEALGTLIDTVA